jgi:hypothetical protein
MKNNQIKTMKNLNSITNKSMDLNSCRFLPIQELIESVKKSLPLIPPQTFLSKLITNNKLTELELIKIITEYSEQFNWIKTTCGLFIKYDDCHYEFLRSQSLFYSSGKINHIKVSILSKNNRRTSTPVAKILLGIKDDVVIHYKDKNPLNIRLDNLIVNSVRSKHFKQKKAKTFNGELPSSKFKGVSWNKFANKWSASIKFEYKKQHIGYFDNEVDAAKAYNEKASELFGDNFSEYNLV